MLDGAKEVNMTIKLDHINLTVSNFKRSVEWYKQIFGFELVETATTAEGVQWGIVAFDDSMICMTEYPDRKRADEVEDSSAHRIYHFGIRVSDVDRWRQCVKEHRLKLYYGGEIDYPSSTSWYIRDPSGHTIEVSYTAAQTLQFPKGGL